MALNKLEEMIIRHEGVVKKHGRHRMYKCTANKTTIGHGRNLDANGLRDDEALLMLKNDIEGVKNELMARLTWCKNINDARMDALVDMGFNLGISSLMTFKKMLFSMEKGLFEDAAKHAANSRWFVQVGARAEEIVMMIRTGEYQ